MTSGYTNNVHMHKKIKKRIKNEKGYSTQLRKPQKKSPWGLHEDNPRLILMMLNQSVPKL